MIAPNIGGLPLFLGKWLCGAAFLLGKGSKLFDGTLPELLRRYDTSRVITLRYEDSGAPPALPEGCALRRAGAGYKITYSPGQVPTASLISLLQSAGPIRELTAQPRNLDHMIAAMYREMDL